MRFEPVFLPEPLGDRGSMTFLRHYDLCPRSGFLYAKHRGTDAKTADMQRGSAFHLMAQRAIELMIENGEVQVPAEVAKDLMNEVLAEVPVPFDQHDYLREATYRWAVETTIDPSAVVACETLFVLDIDGFQVRCKVDLAELFEDGLVCRVPDWKTSRSAPGFEEVARKRSDGSLAAKSFQLVLYALALAFGVPVRLEKCRRCDGVGCEGDGLNGCNLRGYFEIPEPFPLASRAARFDLAFVYPGIETTSDGKMLQRPVSLSRAELDEYRESLAGLVRRVRESERSGDWPAVVSDAACGVCPASAECPIPRELRDHRDSINTVEQATEAAEVLALRAKAQAALREEIKRFCEAKGISLRYGRKVWEFVPARRTKVDRDGLIAAAQRAATYGEPYDPGEFIKVSDGTDWKARDLTDDEASEGSNGEAQ